MSETEFDLEALASMFENACEDLEVSPETIIRNVVTFFKKRCETSGEEGDDVATVGVDGPLIKCIDGSGRTRNIPQSSLYLSLKCVSKM